MTQLASQAQLVESRVINVLQFQTIIASKAARVTLAAPEKLLVDFGLRRAHGAEAGLFAARVSYLAGFSGTSTVLAGLPDYLTQLDESDKYPVEISRPLAELAQEVDLRSSAEP